MVGGLATKDTESVHITRNGVAVRLPAWRSWWCVAVGAAGMIASGLAAIGSLAVIWRPRDYAWYVRWSIALGGHALLGILGIVRGAVDVTAFSGIEGGLLSGNVVMTVAMAILFCYLLFEVAAKRKYSVTRKVVPPPSSCAVSQQGISSTAEDPSSQSGPGLQS
jgi:hypothetical protein